MMMKRLILVLAAALLSVSAVMAQGNTLVDVAERDLTERFDTLLAAVEAAGLTGTLAQDELTLLAPTDGAFLTLLRAEDMSEGELLADVDLLNEVLLYHLLPGTVTFADLEDLAAQRNDGVATVRTLGGGTLRLQVDANADDVDINFGEASIVEADLSADNGVIHVIDNVLLPPEAPMEEDDLIESEVVAGATEEAPGELAVPDEVIVDVDALTGGNIADVIAEVDELSTMAAAVVEANLVPVLEDPNDDEEEDNIGFTVFAPTNEAFTNLAAFVGLTEDDLLNDPVLEDILRYHISEGDKTAEDLAELEGRVVTIIEGGAISVRVTGDGIVTLNNFAEVLQADIPAENGVIHIIDNVLLPTEALEAFGL